MNSKILLVVGLLLVIVGVWKPSISTNTYPVISNNYVAEQPSDADILAASSDVIELLKSSSANNKSEDFVKLASLYADIATLISLDGDNMVVKDTQAVRQVNKLSGLMLKLDIKDKYDGLPEKLQNVVVVAVGQDDVVLDGDMRQKAVDAFRALSWAFYEGNK